MCVALRILSYDLSTRWHNQACSNFNGLSCVYLLHAFTLPVIEISTNFNVFSSMAPFKDVFNFVKELVLLLFELKLHCLLCRLKLHSLHILHILLFIHFLSLLLLLKLLKLLSHHHLLVLGVLLLHLMLVLELEELLMKVVQLLGMNLTQLRCLTTHCHLLLQKLLDQHGKLLGLLLRCH